MPFMGSISWAALLLLYQSQLDSRWYLIRGDYYSLQLLPTGHHCNKPFY